MKKWIIAIVLVVLIAVGAFFYFHHKSSNGETVATVTVTKGDIVEKAQAIGYILPRHSSTVKSSINGTVETIYHDAGDYVQKGTALIKIKPQPEPADYAAAYEAVEETLANERSALSNFQRFSGALKSKLITKNYTDYITAKNNYETARSKRILAEQKLALLDKGTTIVANRSLANIVKSPITGYILSRNVDVGDPVISLSSAQSSTALYTMANMSDLMFEGSVDESDAAKIRLNMPATVTVGASSKNVIKGKLSKIALQSDQENALSGGPAVDSNLPFNVSFQVQITNLSLPKGMVLRSGYSAVADINIKSVKNVLVIPERVLQFSNGKPYVLLPSTKKGAKPQKQPVTIGLSDGMTAQISSGLKLGQKVLDSTNGNSDQ